MTPAEFAQSINPRHDAVLRSLAEEFAADTSDKTRFLNVLVTSTPL